MSCLSGFFDVLKVNRPFVLRKRDEYSNHDCSNWNNLNKLDKSEKTKFLNLCIPDSSLFTIEKCLKLL